METKKKSVSEYIQEYGAFIALVVLVVGIGIRSEEHTSELQSQR